MHMTMTSDELAHCELSTAACQYAGAQDVFREDEDTCEVDIQPDMADGNDTDIGSRWAD